MVDEIKKAVNYYQTEEKGESPSAVIISGGTSGMPDLISMLTGLLGIETLVANPFAKVSADPATLQQLASYSPLYAISVGLAMREE